MCAALLTTPLAARAQTGGVPPPAPAGTAPAPAAPAAPAAATPDDLFRQGNEAYLKEDYAGAVRAYEGALAVGLEHEDVYFNLGNAHFRAGQIGRAILNYERALVLDPHADDVRQNLKLARERNVDKVVGGEGAGGGGHRFWDDLFSSFSSTTATVAFLVPYLAFFVLVLLARRVRDAELHRTLALAALPVALVALLTGVVFAGKVYWTERVAKGVVLSAEVAVKEGPDAKFKTVFEVHEGLTVRLADEQDGWWKIRLLNGLEGWIPESAVGRI